MHVLQLAYDYPPYILWGSGIHCDILARSLVALGHGVTVAVPRFTLSSEPPGGSDPLVLRVPIEFPVPPNECFSGHDFRRNLDAINNGMTSVLQQDVRTPPDVIHVHSWMLYAAAAALADIWMCPLIATLHILEADFLPSTSDPSLRALAQDWEHRLLAATDAVIVPSEFIRRRLAMTVAPTPDIYCIHHGIDLTLYERWEPSAYYSQVRKVLGDGPDVVLFLGRLERIKGCQVLLEASPIVLAERPDTIFLVVGSGRDLLSLMTTAASMKNIIFAGQVLHDRVIDFYHLASVVAIPSLSESFCLVAAEALASGCPVVASDAGAIPEIIEDGRVGRVVPVSRTRDGTPVHVDPEKLACAILTSLSDRRASREMALRGMTYARQHLASGRMARDTARVYERVVNLKGGIVPLEE